MCLAKNASLFIVCLFAVVKQINLVAWRYYLHTRYGRFRNRWI